MHACVIYVTSAILYIVHETMYIIMYAGIADQSSVGQIHITLYYTYTWSALFLWLSTCHAHAWMESTWWGFDSHIIIMTYTDPVTASVLNQEGTVLSLGRNAIGSWCGTLSTKNNVGPNGWSYCGWSCRMSLHEKLSHSFNRAENSNSVRILRHKLLMNGMSRANLATCVYTYCIYTDTETVVSSGKWYYTVLRIGRIACMHVHADAYIIIIQYECNYRISLLTPPIYGSLMWIAFGHSHLQNMAKLRY